jgi:hypothetical protein
MEERAPTYSTFDTEFDDLSFGAVQDRSKIEERAPTYSTLANSPDWLKRISQQPGSNVNNDYYYDTTQGAGSKVYIIDTGYFTNAAIPVSFQAHDRE